MVCGNLSTETMVCGYLTSMVCRNLTSEYHGLWKPYMETMVCGNLTSKYHYGLWKPYMETTVCGNLTSMVYLC
jgi:hypothetical protein